MKLGLIAMSDRDRDVRDSLSLADSFGFDQAYLPGLTPHQIPPKPTQGLKIALDAASFGPLTPSEMETAVRKADAALEGKLLLGVDVGCDTGSTKLRADAQNFETLFSHHPRHAFDDPPRRFPMRPPCPKIIGLPVTGSSAEAAIAASRGYFPMTPSWLNTGDIARHWPAIVGGATSAVRRANPYHWQLARTIVVHENAGRIEDYVFGSNSPIRRYYARAAQRGLIGADIDRHMKRVVIAGSAEQVARQIVELERITGVFGKLNMIDHRGSDMELTRDTMIHLAEQVMPMVAKIATHKINELEKT